MNESTGDQLPALSVAKTHSDEQAAGSAAAKLPIMRRIFIAPIRVYQMMSRLTPPICRFSPTCSEYTVQAISRYGIFAGGWMGVKRIFRCHPWSAGGYDPVAIEGADYDSESE